MRPFNQTRGASFTGCYDARILAAFEHSWEYHQLRSKGFQPRYVASVLEMAEALWLGADDITGPLLLELLYDVPRVLHYEQDEILTMVRELHAFWSFTARECAYPHARECLLVLERDGAQALECALAEVATSPTHLLAYAR